ncbi:hypothetical protein D9M71_668620 [compost metagenome]
MRSAEEVALAEVAAELAQRVTLSGLLDAFRQYGDPHAVAEGDDRAGDGHVRAVVGQATDETLVDLQLVYREMLEAGQR